MDKCLYCETDPMMWKYVGPPVPLCEYHTRMRADLWERLWANGNDEGWLDLAMLVEVADDTTT
jgi:hypothetical protein